MQEHASAQTKSNRIRFNVYLDLLLALVFLVDMEVQFSGLALHEILGLLVAIACILHVILHWDWIVSITRAFFRNLLHESRFNYMLNIALFVDTVILSVSGILISRTLGLNIRFEQDTQQLMHSLHLVGAEILLMLTAVHVAMHWKWIRANTVKYLLIRFPLIGRPHNARNRLNQHLDTGAEAHDAL